MAWLGACAALAAWTGASRAAEAPPAAQVSPAISHYHKVAPWAATAGLLGPGGLEEVRRLGFALVIDLRTAGEGAEAERRAARRLGIAYVNLPIATRAPTPAQVATFVRAVADPANRPVLVHCYSASRAGAMWALYVASQGHGLEEALAAGRAAGLTPSREQAVRALIASAPGGDVTERVVPSGSSGDFSRTDQDTLSEPGAVRGNPFDRNDDEDMGC